MYDRRKPVDLARVVFISDRTRFVNYNYFVWCTEDENLKLHYKFAISKIFIDFKKITLAVTALTSTAS